MTIEHLGSNMYSRLPNAVAELVANAFDADASDIEVRVSGSGAAQTIAVVDDGHGMTRAELQEKYLRIGRNRRDSPAGEKSESGRRLVSGKKGLGKLALFGIGSEVEVRTKRAGDDSGTQIVLNWEQLRKSDAEYTPLESTFIAPAGEHGTTVTIRQLDRKTDINGADLATSLSRLFNYADEQLLLTVLDRDNREHPVDAATRLDGIDAEFEWAIPHSHTLDATLRNDLETYGISGRVVAARKPLPTQVRGITVYANGRMVNEPEFFDASDSSYAYAYLTGFVQVDHLDEITPDVIATDRRAVNWDVPNSRSIAVVLRTMVMAIAQDRRKRREAARSEVTKEKTGLDPQQWVNSMRDPRSENVGKLLATVTSEDADLPDATMAAVVDQLQKIAPLYAELFWRRLHPRVQYAAQAKYQSRLYLEAVVEAQKAFIGLVRRRSGITGEAEGKLVEKAIGSGNDVKLQLLGTLDSGVFWDLTRKSFESGHRELAKGVASAFRNPASHQTLVELEAINLYSWQDCLDALGVISYLCRRVDAATEAGSGETEEGQT